MLSRRCPLINIPTGGPAVRRGSLLPGEPGLFALYPGFNLPSDDDDDGPLMGLKDIKESPPGKKGEPRRGRYRGSRLVKAKGAAGKISSNLINVYFFAGRAPSGILR